MILGKPNTYGSIFRFEGQASVFATKDGPCYRCLYPEPPPPGLVPSCAEGGVLGVLPGVIGTIQATEAVKLIMGIGEPLIGRFLIYDALRMKFRELKLKKDPDCPVCGTHPTVTALIDYEQFCGVAPAAEPVMTAKDNNETEIDVRELKRKMDAKEDFFLLDVREPNEYQIGRIPGSTLIPLGEVPQRYQEIPQDREIVVHCKMGGRSAKGGGVPPPAGLHERQEPERRHSGLVGQDRPICAKILRAVLQATGSGRPDAYDPKQYVKAVQEGGLRAHRDEAPGAAPRPGGVQRA